MNLLVLGATGGVGLEIVAQALEKGHRVTAFVRTPGKLDRFAGRINIIRGDVLDPAQLADAIRGRDAVVSGFGPRVPLSKSDHDLQRRFAAALAEAMKRAKVPRLVHVSTAFLFKDALFPPANLVGRLFFAPIVADAASMEEILRHSGLDWTIVRPPRLTDGRRTAKYRVRDGHLPSFGFAISRADVADFMLKTAGDRGSVGHIIGVAA